jgi:hypothetical protein
MWPSLKSFWQVRLKIGMQSHLVDHLLKDERRWHDSRTLGREMQLLELFLQVDIELLEGRVELKDFRLQNGITGPMPPLYSLRDILPKYPVERLRMASVKRFHESKDHFFLGPMSRQIPLVSDPLSDALEAECAFAKGSRRDDVADLLGKRAKVLDGRGGEFLFVRCGFPHFQLVGFSFFHTRGMG